MTGKIAIIGCGPAGIMSAISFARRGVETVVIEANGDPSTAPSYNPDRSYAIDVTGHGLNAIAHIDAVEDFDWELIRFKGIDAGKGGIHPWDEPGWIGSRGDIMRVLMKIIGEKYSKFVTFQFNSPVTGIDFETGSLTWSSKIDGQTFSGKYDLVIAADGGGSIIRKKAEQDVAGFALTYRDASYYCKMIALDNAGGELDETHLHVLNLKYPCVAGAINGPDGKEDPIWFCQVPFSSKKDFRDVEAARSFLAKNSPKILELASDQAVETFS
ncbi:MAG: FAD-dependent monooxygenase, partial [Pseudomonadota bacterium]